MVIFIIVLNNTDMTTSNYTKIAVIGIAVFVIMGILVLRRMDNGSTSKQPKLTIDENSLVEDLGLEVITNEDSLENNENIGLFNIKYPDEFKIDRNYNEMCNWYIDNPSECLKIEHLDTGSYILIKREELSSDIADFGGGSIIRNYFDSGTFFLLEDVVLLRSTTYSNIDPNFKKYDIAFVQSVIPRFEGNYGNFSYWYIQDNNGYTISYFINNLLDNGQEITLLNSLDKVISTLNLNE